MPIRPPSFVLALNLGSSRFRVDSSAVLFEIAASFSDDSLAQLVEHVTFNDGVDGSSPSRVTNLQSAHADWNFKSSFGGFEGMFPSSSGLGHLPFTEDTGVRIPLGTPIFRRKIPRFSHFDFLAACVAPASSNGEKLTRKSNFDIRESVEHRSSNAFILFKRGTLYASRILYVVSI